MQVPGHARESLKVLQQSPLEPFGSRYPGSMRHPRVVPLTFLRAVITPAMYDLIEFDSPDH